MNTIDYYFSVLSPFTYLAGLRLEEVAANNGAGVNYKPMDIIHLFGETGGVPPKDRHWSRQEYRLQELGRIAKHAGLPINLKPAHWPTDPVPASCAIIAAQMTNKNVGPLAHAFTRAVWSEQLDIAQPDTVDAVLTESGIDPEAISTRLDAARSAFQRNTSDAVEGGVFGAPFYVVDGERFWGQDRLDYLGRHLQTIA